MKKLIYILTMFVVLAVACENPNGDETTVDNTTALTYTSTTIAGHEAVIVKPTTLGATAPLVVVVADDLELKTRFSPVPATPDVNFKIAEHTLLGHYTLCIVSSSDVSDASFLRDVKGAFPNATRAYLISYRNGMAYTAAMQIPKQFAAYACVSGAIDVETYKANNFTRSVPFVHVHATGNTECKWEGVKDKSVSVPMSVAAVVAANECVSYKTSELYPREGKGRVSCTHYTNSLSNCDVKLYSVDSENSGWCDEEFEVYSQIWNFFKSH